jgi:hypothetical protein
MPPESMYYSMHHSILNLYIHGKLDHTAHLGTICLQRVNEASTGIDVNQWKLWSKPLTNTL